MTMIEGYDIFKSCFSEINITEEQYSELFKDCTVFLAPEEGVAMVKDDTIHLVAVRPECRGSGLGTQLLSACEESVMWLMLGHMNIGGSPMCGAVGDSVAFFEKNGYTKHGDYVEMGMDIGGYQPPDIPLSADAEFRFCTDDIETLREAVAAVDEEWVQYFTDVDSVFCGYVDGILASFCIIGTDELCLLSDESSRVGSIGCVGTLPEYRGRGIGLSMVSKATEYLRDNGCDKSFIHYTHLEDWYGKLGYKTFLRFSPMSKKT